MDTSDTNDIVRKHTQKAKVPYYNPISLEALNIVVSDFLCKWLIFLNDSELLLSFRNNKFYIIDVVLFMVTGDTDKLKKKPKLSKMIVNICIFHV